MDSLEAGHRLLTTLDHYLAVAYGSFNDPDASRATRLAAADVHEPIRNTLAAFGEVELLTEEDAADTACIYRVVGPEGFRVDAYISSVLPYAAALLAKGDKFVGYLDASTAGWAERVVSGVIAHGIVLLPDRVCRSTSPMLDVATGKHLSYFQALFASEADTPGEP
jgi:hypothetical protein